MYAVTYGTDAFQPCTCRLGGMVHFGALALTLAMAALTLAGGDGPGRPSLSFMDEVVALRQSRLQQAQAQGGQSKAPRSQDTRGGPPKNVPRPHAITMAAQDNATQYVDLGTWPPEGWPFTESDDEVR
jgi:hypothetical protein